MSPWGIRELLSENVAKFFTDLYVVVRGPLSGHFQT